MRIAKIADEEGGGADTGGADEAGGSLRGRAGAGGGFDAGRGGTGTGRGGAETDFCADSALASAGSEGVRPAPSAGSDGARAPPSAGSDGERVVAGAPSAFSNAVTPGFERRRGIGGGELSGAFAVGSEGTPGSGADSLARLTVSTAPPSAEYEIVGAIGALSALDVIALSSAASAGGLTEGGPDVGPESRRGFGGGASFREGATESCAVATSGSGGAALSAGGGVASRPLRSTSSVGSAARTEDNSAFGTSAASLALARTVSSELSIVIQLSIAIRRNALCRADDRC